MISLIVPLSLEIIAAMFKTVLLPPSFVLLLVCSLPCQVNCERLNCSLSLYKAAPYLINVLHNLLYISFRMELTSLQSAFKLIVQGVFYLIRSFILMSDSSDIFCLSSPSVIDFLLLNIYFYVLLTYFIYVYLISSLLHSICF